MIMRGMRRNEKAIQSNEEMTAILRKVNFVTIAMCDGNEPYLVTLSHGYDESKNCIYFHCAQEGKKIDILKENNIVWGQALQDHGYDTGECDHHYATVHFKGRVTFIDDIKEKRQALIVMIRQLEAEPQTVVDRQISEQSLKRVNIGRIDIEYMTGKKSKEVVISL